MKLTNQNNQLIVDEHSVTYNDRVIFNQTTQSPIFFLGTGDETVQMNRGNFKLDDHVGSKIPLTIITLTKVNQIISIQFGYQSTVYLEVNLSLDEVGRLIVAPKVVMGSWNRLWVRINADQDEKVYGAGEQMSYFNLRGHHFPLWTSEPGIGRNKRTLTTFYADQHDQAGGDYYTTNYPEQTFISTNHYYCHTASYYYADFDFRNDQFHELLYWGIPQSLIFETADDYVQLIEKLTGLLGRQPRLPEWTNQGLVAGLQGGTERVERIRQTMQDHEVQLAGIWAQDWQGIRMTSFGKRLFWNWQTDEQLYPNLVAQIKQWQQVGVRFLGYINPYVADDSPMFKQVENLDYFAKTTNGEIYRVDFGEFTCGVVDFTNPAAFKWFKRVIKTNLIDNGFAGWMADFGEYLPTDVVLYDHSDPKVMHNKWPLLWAKCNYEAVHEAGKQADIVYFMRAGTTGSQRYNPLLWAGDQSVNWSMDDGLASTIPAALSAGMTGNGLSHSDIGGYTSMYGNVRTKELFMRWAEMAAFTPFMRSHEGNRPDENFQVYDDDQALDHLARYTKIFRQLTPYRQSVIDEVATRGLPAQRPLFLHYEDDSRTYDISYEYLFGRDLLVAPVYKADQQIWQVYLPDDEWVNLWNGQPLTGGDHLVKAPVGQIPVFYRQSSRFKKLFEDLKLI